MKEQEGVIKFRAQHRAQALDAERFGGLGARLTAWREILSLLGIVGQDPARYEGAGFGNVSARVGPFPGEPGRRGFLITGTQTGAVRCMRLEHYCVVERYSLEENRVESFGSALPSSESMTHGAIYDLCPSIRYVLHAHCPAIWKQAKALKLPETHKDVPYGTVEMAREVRRLYRTTNLAEGRLFSMAGHEDGVVVFGKTAEDAGEVLVRCLARAYEAVCQARGDLCAR
jgi:ribulose-5-phosphate 4-epimerase/fuculose-1-phosphate aldolase